MRRVIAVACIVLAAQAVCLERTDGTEVLVCEAGHLPEGLMQS